MVNLASEWTNSTNGQMNESTNMHCIVVRCISKYESIWRIAEHNHRNRMEKRANELVACMHANVDAYIRVDCRIFKR